jgi:hypothetical protein
MEKFYSNGHSIVVKGRDVIVDGKTLDVKLKRSLFMGNVTTINTNSSSISLSSEGDIINVGECSSSSKIKIGRNTIICDKDKISVNGQEFSFNGVAVSSDKKDVKGIIKNKQSHLSMSFGVCNITINGKNNKKIDDDLEDFDDNDLTSE